MTQELRDDPGTKDQASASDGAGGDGVSLVEYIVAGLCLLGIIVALYVVLDYSDIPLFDGHAAEVIADFWDRYANIGMVVVVIVVAGVSAFVWVLAKSTLGSDRDEYRLDLDLDGDS